jgi:hypothetical protein
VKRERSGASKMLIWSKHIYVFLVHVFHEAFYFQTLLKIVPGYRVCWQRFGVDFDFPKNGMWLTTGGVLGIPEECQLHQ